VMTSRQVRNGQLRTMGIEPSASYHRHVGPGDEVAISTVKEQPFRAERFLARVLTVLDHGHYSLVRYERIDDGSRGTARVHADGPPDWGVIEFRVVRKVHRPLLRRADRGGGPLSSPQSPTIRLPVAERCPACGTMVKWKPRMGWPCLECRRQEEGES